MKMNRIVLTLFLVSCLVSSPDLVQCQSQADSTPKDQCTPVADLTKTTWWLDASTFEKVDRKEKIRCGGISVYNDEIYLVSIRYGTARTFNIDFESKKWVLSKDTTLVTVVNNILGKRFFSMGISAMEILGDTLFIEGVSKSEFEVVDLNNGSIIYSPSFETPEYKGSNGTCGISFNHPVVYMAFMSLDYDRSIEETQRLIAHDITTGEKVIDRPLFPSEQRRNMAHALTFAEGYLWHMKDNNLVKMDGSTGEILDRYTIDHIDSATAICYHKKSLWIATRNGDLVEVPLVCN